jgi:hypothetical protein
MARFTKIKCDIEGGEYRAFLGVKIPESVNEMWFETHTFNEQAMDNHKKLIEDMEAQ